MRLIKPVLGMMAFLIAMFPALAWAEQREFNLTIDEVSIDVAPGFSNKVFAFNGQVPGPLIHVKEGDDVTVHVTNNTTLPHTIHWHGINQTGSWQNDGVPGVTQEAIQPGETFTYKLKTDRPGSLWYHCHVNVWEHVALRGMWGPLIVDPKKPSALEKNVTKEVIMMLSSLGIALCQSLRQRWHAPGCCRLFFGERKIFSDDAADSGKKGRCIANPDVTAQGMKPTRCICTGTTC